MLINCVCDSLGAALIAVGSCTKCQKFCNFIYKPQCAYNPDTKDYKFFSNDCELKNYNCENENDGKLKMLHKNYVYR